MTAADLQRRFDYGYWANQKLFPVIAGLTPEQFTQNVAGSYGSVRNTMVHIMSAEWGWLDRCGGQKRGPALTPEDFPTVESVTETWGKVEGHMREFLASLSDDDLARMVEFSNPRGEKRAMILGELLEHSANHAVHHRGQVALLLRALGVVPGNFDLIFFDGERHKVSMW